MLRQNFRVFFFFVCVVWMGWPFKVTPYTINGHISQLALLSFLWSLCERRDLQDLDVLFWREPLCRELLSRLWEHCFWAPYEERVYASCQKFVNSLPELHRHLQCHSRCHFLLGEVVISNFNFAMWSKPYMWMCVRARARANVCSCTCRLACAEINLCRLVCVSASLRLRGRVLQHRYLMCRIVPEEKQDVCHLSPESDTVNLAMSPQTTISGVKGYKEGTYRLISPFNLDFTLVTLPTFLVWPMAQDWTYSLKVLWRSKQLAA